MREIRVHRLGRVAYGDAVAMQRTLVEERRADRIPDTLLLLQHPHVLTLGAKLAAARAHVVAAPGELAARGVEVFEAGRGGDVTYHGPGQLVAYPILDLRPDRCDVHRYVRDLEEVMIRVVRRFRARAGTRGRFQRHVDRRPEDWRGRRAHFPLGHQSRRGDERLDRSRLLRPDRPVRHRR